MASELPGSSWLEKQQEYITTALGFGLHPTIRQSLSSSSGVDRKVRIAIVSNMTLSASSDQSLDMASVQISTEEISSSTGLDPELVEHFDVVVVNLLHTSLETDQWEATTQNLMDILKPNGWLQWIDWDPITARIAGSKPGTPDASNLREILRRYTDALQDRKVGSTYRISNALRSQGFVDIDSDLYPVAPDTGFTGVVAQGALRYLERTGYMSTDQAGASEAKIRDELQASGPLVWYDLWCHIAQTPSEP